MKNTFIETELKDIEKKGLKRSLTVIHGEQAARVRINGKEAILLCSNNYLGLANHPLLKEAMINAVERYGAGSGASRLVSGTMEAHIMLEEKLRSFKKSGSVVLFNSGYHANTGCIPALVGRDDAIFSDKLNHASIIDGCMLSRALLKRYPHRDTNALETLLKKSASKRKLIVTDGVFSMDGCIAPLKEIIYLSDKYGAMVYLDDAHGVGVMGRCGRGTLEHLGIEHPNIVEMGTLGKAIGAYGAYISGSASMREFLITKARPFIYSTSLPPSICAASVKAIEIMEKEPERKANLIKNTNSLRESFKILGLDTLDSSTHIIPLVIKDAGKTMRITKKLLEKGVFVQGIRPPTVPENTSRLRITLTSEHEKKDIEFSLNMIKEVFRDEETL